MSAAYEAAWKFCLISMKNGDQPLNPAIQQDDMRKITPFLPQIGFQPLGLAADPDKPDHFTVADYYSPSVISFKVVRTKRGGLELQRERWIGWVNRAGTSTTRVRVFPELAPGSDSKRGQTVMYRPNGELWVTYCGSTNRIFRLKPDATAKTGWRLNRRPLILEGNHDTPVKLYVDAATINNDILYVVRNTQTGEPCWLEAYDLNGRRLETSYKCPAATWIYGIGFRGNDPAPYFITDSQCVEVPLGIYRGEKLVVPNVFGQGLAFLADGSALVSQYNLPRGKFGLPGCFVRVPTHFFHQP